ncbi:MAG TPA: hypothetical protein VLM20_02950 [Methylophilaceae bacterium]|nr:hypothetical protein [Methylophilaceae bacterium]
MDKRRYRIVQIVQLMFAANILHVATREEAIKGSVVYNLAKFRIWANRNVTLNNLN